MCAISGKSNLLASDAACVEDVQLRPIYFDYDKSTIRTDAEATLQANLAIINSKPAMRIRIEGNADERGSDEYNIALGQRRAQSAKKWLIDHGVDAGRIDIVSYGEERPVCQDHDETCWQQNRRDDFVITISGPADE
jgi:peptidoglycan-associated lipoprotein